MVESIDLETFEARHGRALTASIVEHSRFAFLLPRLKAADASGHARLWSAGDGSACALLCRGTLVFGDLDGTAIDAIAQDALAWDLRQIGGPEPSVMRDFACVRRWLSDFQREALPDQQMPPQSAQDARCERLIDAGSIALWERDGTPVSMAAVVQDLEQYRRHIIGLHACLQARTWLRRGRRRDALDSDSRKWPSRVPLCGRAQRDLDSLLCEDRVRFGRRPRQRLPRRE